jgi:acetolactate synthase-1/2/3 large subunit
MIECCHEEIAVGIAHGYAKACGKPMLTILHNVVGLLHGVMAIYYAYLDRIPLIIVGATGPMDTTRRRPRTDWIHTAMIQGNAVREFVKWDDQPYTVESIPDSFARAYRVAMTEPKGPVYVCYDVTLQEDPLEREIGFPDLNRVAVPSPIQADGAALDKASELLLRARNPVVVAGYLGRNPRTVDTLVELAELLALPVMDMNNRFNFPNIHPLDLTGSEKHLTSADLVLSLDVRDLNRPLTKLDRVSRRTTYITPQGCKIVEMGFSDLEISSWSQDFQKLQEVDLSILADTSVGLPELMRRCRKKLEGNAEKKKEIKRRFERLSREHEDLRRRWRDEAQKGWDKKPMTTARLAWEIWEVVKDEDWVLTANTLQDWARKLWDWDKPYRHPGKSLGTATQIGISLGVALAYKGTDKLVIDIQPDGDLLFDASALWVAAYHKIPLLIVMYNNRAYYNDWEHQIRIARERNTPVERAYIGMEIDNPPPDFAKLAQSFGWYAEGPIEDGSQVRDALKRAIQVIKKETTPALVDTVTQYR